MMTDTLSIIISLIWGFGLALLFRKSCDNDKCVIIKSPPELGNGGLIQINGNSILLNKYNYPCYQN